MWRKESVSLDRELKILTGMIISNQFLREMQTLYKSDLFEIPYVRIVAGWCNEYYKTYSAAPGDTIQEIYNSRVREGLFDETNADLVDDFLSGLSDVYSKGEKFNAKYEIDNAEKYLKRRKLVMLKEDITSALATDDVEEAEQLVGEFRRVERPRGNSVDPIADEDAIINAFDNAATEDELFCFPGALGKAVGMHERSQLWAIVAPMKRGKSWWLMYIALHALLAGYNVLFASFEMSERKMLQRIHHSLSGLPKKKYAGVVRIPIFDCEFNQTDCCEKEERRCNVGLVDEDGGFPELGDAPRKYRVCTACKECKPAVWYKEVEKEEITSIAAIKKARAVSRTFLRGNQLKMVEFPSKTITISQFNIYVDNLEHYEDFTADVIITDYADKFRGDPRVAPKDQISEIWEGHKSLAQRKHALVWTASQSNTARTGKDVTQGDWADEIRKLAVVDGAVALNQSREEKEAGIMRAKVLAQRDDDFDLIREVLVLQQLRIGKPYLDSHLV